MKAVAAALAGIVMASTPSLAADLFGSAPPMTFPAQDSPTAEVGANWYLRGDIGGSLDTAGSLSLADVSNLPVDSSIGSSHMREDLSADIGVGYRFNNYLRGEVTYDYRLGPGGGNSNTVLCPSGLCNGNLSLQQHDSTGLASAYADLGTYWDITPYVGAGVGVNANSTSGSVAYTTTATGAPYTAWSHSFDSTKYTFAWALMAGVGIQLSPSATLDLGYRYLNAGDSTTSITPQIGSSVRQSNVSQEFRIGIRYMAN